MKMKQFLIGLLALFTLAVGSSSASASYCRGPHGWGRYPPYVCNGGADVRRGGYYRQEQWGGSGYVTRYGVRTVTSRRHHTVGGGVPSPEWIAAHVPHHQERVCVPCVHGYVQDPGTCQCTRTTWHPGPPPQ